MFLNLDQLEAVMSADQDDAHIERDDFTGPIYPWGSDLPRISQETTTMTQPTGTVFASMTTIPTKPGRPSYKLHTRLADGSIARLQCAVCQRKFKTLSATRIYCTTRCAATMRPPCVDTDTTTWF